MIAITGATGQTGSKIAHLLLNRGKDIRVLGRSESKLLPFKERKAEIAVGDQADLLFLTKAFDGCDAVYLLIPPKMDAPDVRSYYNTLGDISVEALRISGVKKVVFLSSLGEELTEETGPVIGLHDVEEKLKSLARVDIAILHPGYFMENILSNVLLIKNQHINGNSISPDAPVAMIATKDIAEKAAELLATLSFTGHTIIELFGDRLSYSDLTRYIGEAIGTPDLPYIQFSKSDAIVGMTGMRLSESMAKLFVELASAIENGLIHPLHIDPLKPNTPTTFKMFAHDVFKPVFQQAK